MADEEKKTVETPVEESKLQKENKALKAEAKHLAAEIDDLKKRLHAESVARTTAESVNKVLEKKVGELVAAAEELNRSATDDSVTIDGQAYQVVDVDTALELMDKVRKSYVEQDAPVAVLRKL